MEGAIKLVASFALARNFVVQTPVPDPGREKVCKLEVELWLQLVDKIRITLQTGKD